MGSGQGKNRRSQAVRARRTGGLKGTQRRVVAKKFSAMGGWEAWHQFVRQGELKKVRVQEYYLGPNVPLRVSDGDYEKLMAEMLADMVSVGAVALHGKHKLEDFEFKMEDREAAYGMVLRLRSSPEQFGKILNPAYYLSPGVMMGSTYVSSYLKRFQEVMRDSTHRIFKDR